ncbi:hypothetical protein CONLIGDRAFT_376501 [Coniochaeta ligniaria NRRL 30616]|uniref:Uncharacterized protein n=1 Tax=Coniochaeta ligniaria NRRL 30616 TaxID=1408157 RepID=A0A1J7JFF2_9PEZI|nr:hypothetical protein CONLIGDRAFT_376501 [Coniochaeta ligniaria NRRL 30616]
MLADPLLVFDDVTAARDFGLTDALGGSGRVPGDWRPPSLRNVYLTSDTHLHSSIMAETEEILHAFLVALGSVVLFQRCNVRPSPSNSGSLGTAHCQGAVPDNLGNIDMWLKTVRSRDLGHAYQRHPKHFICRTWRPGGNSADRYCAAISEQNQSGGLRIDM